MNARSQTDWAIQVQLNNLPLYESEAVNKMQLLSIYVYKEYRSISIYAMSFNYFMNIKCNSE